MQHLGDSSVQETRLICPVCFDPLTVGPSVANCPRSHTFDRAREGYFNLLLANQKGSADPGDDRDAVTARREFLAAGHYSFLAEAIERAVVGQGLASPVIVDVGCSEGYFLSHLTRGTPGIDAYGLDISRSAMRLASRSHRYCTWAVANIARRLPIADVSCDILLSIMAPRNAAEFARILRPDGMLLVIVPGTNHLGELTNLLMARQSDQSAKPDELSQSLGPAFEVESSESIRDTFTADQRTLQRLVTMTPLRWKSRKSALSDLALLESLEVTASFTLLTLTPRT